MNTQENFFTDTRNKVQEYIQEKILLLKLKLIAKASRLISKLITSILMAIVGLFILLFLSIMAGYFFSELTGSNIWGFGIVAGIYIVILFIIMAIGKKAFQKSMIDKLIHSLLEKNHNDESN